MKTFITGVNSGLGKYLYRNMGGAALTRDTTPEEIEEIKTNGIETIIHCAFNSGKKADSGSLYDYLEDNIMLTKKLVSFPHKKFIFISSVDVYTKNGKEHSEEEPIDIDSVKDMYGVTKLMSEAIIQKSCRDYLILRPSALLGEYSRRNSLIKIMEEEEPAISLSGESTLNYVLHSSVLDFLKISMKKGLGGIFNLASSGNIALSDIAGIAGKKVRFGSFVYNVGDIDNRKASSVYPFFRNHSKEIVTQYIKGRYE